jgi:hypothetical protein
VTRPAPAIEGATAAQDAARDWQAVHADPTIQFTPVNVQIKPPETPGWLKAIAEFLQAVFEPVGKALGLSWGVLQWVLMAAAVAVLLYGLFRIFEPLLEGRRHRAAASAGEPEWVPEEHEALALLEDADRLAAEGKFDEATHLLLIRSVQHISATQPGWVQRASTAREIAGLPGLSEGARGTFGLIATRVERSLFALRKLGADDWQAAREAYASFALERLAA